MSILWYLFYFLTLEVVVLFLPPLLGSLLFRLGKYREAILLFRAAFFLSRFVGSWRGPVSLNLCSCYLMLGEFAEARTYAEIAIQSSLKEKRRNQLALARAFLGIILMRQGENAEAEALFDEALRNPLPPRWRSHIALYAGNGYLQAGRMEEAERLLQEVRTAKKTQKDIRLAAEVNLCACYYYQGRVEEALEIARSEPAHTAQTPWVRVGAQTNLLVCLTALGLLEEAEQAEAKLVPMLHDVEPYLKSSPFRAIAELALRKGDLDRARSYAEQAIPLDTRPNAQANALLVQAEVFAARQNTRRAADLCADALRLATIPFYRSKAEHLLQQIQSPDSRLEMESKREADSSLPQVAQLRTME